jgi:hypothetical protein
MTLDSYWGTNVSYIYLNQSLIAGCSNLFGFIVVQNSSEASSNCAQHIRWTESLNKEQLNC